MSRVVMLWLDGFSSRYLTPEKTPFLSASFRSGFGVTIEPMFAFAGIGASIFTGAPMQRHRVWCDWVLDDTGARLPAVFRGLLRLADLVPHDILNQYLRYGLFRLWGRNPGTPNLIPVGLVDCFRTKEGRRLSEPGAVPGLVTLPDQLRAQGVPFSLGALYESIYEGNVAGRVLRALEAGERFVLLRLASLDRLGHKHGPESRQVARRLRQIDEAIGRLAEKLRSRADGCHLVIFSEHGMAPVTATVDMLGHLGRLPLASPMDYVLFLNSTVACLWPRHEAARRALSDALKGIEGGRVLDDGERQRLGLEAIGEEYGQILFALDEGLVFFPDFYRRRRAPRGMHGYAHPSDDDRPVFMLLSADGQPPAGPARAARFIDVMPTVLGLLGVPVPPTCEGRSLLDT